MNDQIRVITGAISDLAGDRSLISSALVPRRVIVRVSFTIGDPPEHIEFTEGGGGSEDSPYYEGEYLAVAVAPV